MDEQTFWAETSYERFMAASGMEPTQLVTRRPVIEDPEERSYADFIHAAGGIPWTTRRS